MDTDALLFVCYTATVLDLFMILPPIAFCSNFNYFSISRDLFSVYREKETSHFIFFFLLSYLELCCIIAVVLVHLAMKQ